MTTETETVADVLTEMRDYFDDERETLMYIARIEAALQQQLNTSDESLLSWMLNNLLTDSQLDVRPPGMSHTLRYMSGETPKPVVSDAMAGTAMGGE